LSRSIANPKVLSEVAAGEWLLGANLEVLGGAALEVSAPTARWLKLSSNPNGFASLKAIGGRIDVTGACVTSWDAGQNSADTEYDTGRSFLLARDGAQTVIDRAELRLPRVRQRRVLRGVLAHGGHRHSRGWCGFGVGACQRST
jgi:hypothetical protein